MHKDPLGDKRKVFNAVFLDEEVPSSTRVAHFEPADDSVVVLRMLIVVAGLPSEQVEGVQPVFKVTVLALQFLVVDLHRQPKTERRTTCQQRCAGCLEPAADVPAVRPPSTCRASSPGRLQCDPSSYPWSPSCLDSSL